MSIPDAIAEFTSTWYYKVPFHRDNPNLAPLVDSYLAGGARPTDAQLGTNHFGRGLALLEDERRAAVPAPTPSVGMLFPAAFHIWGGNSPQAMQVCDLVVASRFTDANPAQARKTNPRLIALGAPYVPSSADRSFSFTYGGGLEAFTGNAQLRAFDVTQDRGCKQADGIWGFAVNKPATASFIRDAAWWSWVNQNAASLGYDGVWSDNLIPGENISAGWFYGSSAPPAADWNTGLVTICQGLRDKGVPIVGGNGIGRAGDPKVRAATNVALEEVLDQLIAQGPNAYWGRVLELQAWQNAAPAPRYLAMMHVVEQADAAGQRFGLALATIAGAAYMPYSQATGWHSSLYFPAELKRGSLGLPVGPASRSANTFSRAFQHGTVTANFDTKTAVI